MTRRPRRRRRPRTPDPNAPGASRRSLLWRARRPLFFLGVVVIASMVGVLWVASQVQIPTTNPIVDQTSFICAADVAEDCNEDNAIASLHGDVNRVVVPLDQISPEMQNAVLAAEDKDFFKHGGVDPIGIARAAWIDIRGGATTHGGSTLTQQYVKLTYLSSERTFKRKIKEAILSVKLEQQMDKKEIFERYLNLVYFGRGAYGVQAAAQTYFGIDASQIDLAQAAYLAGIVRNPSWANDEDKGRTLRNVVLGNMLDNGMIDEHQRAAAAAAPIDVIDYVPTTGVNWLGGEHLGSTSEDPYATRYFVQSVIEQLTAELGQDEVFNGGLRVYTTLQPERQRQAFEAVTGVLGTIYDAPSGALVAIDNNGGVVAMVAGQNYDEDKVNLATGAGSGGRQVGSTFKAFALADLARRGYSITSSLPAQFDTTFLAQDYPDELTEDWRVRSDCCGSGVASVVDATADSINSSYARMMLELGPAEVVQTTHDLGVRTRFERIDGTDRYLPAYVLGAVNIPLVEVADAFSTFARNGVQMDATTVARVEDRTGNVIANFTPDRKQVLTPTQNARVVYALRQVMQRGTGVDADIGRPAAGKTGTVAEADRGEGDDLEKGERNSDAWFTGFVPGFTASVWMGYESGNRLMPASFSGSAYPAEIWRTFMEAALADTPPADFPDVDDLDGGEYLTTWGGTGALPPAWTVEDFANGARPTPRPRPDDQPATAVTSGGGSSQGDATWTPDDATPGTTAPPPPDSAASPPSSPPPTEPPETAPPSTAPPPPTEPPPVTQPPEAVEPPGDP